MYKIEYIKIKNIVSFKDTTFEFRQGKPTLIVGENLDDSGQHRNGSGKSSLIEAIVLAFTGEPIRKGVKVKELIYCYDECDYGEVEIKLYNTVYRCEIKIRRRIYKGSKSAEYQAWVDGREQGEHYSDFHTFNAWLFNIIGISKEDFFAFYVITLSDYTPFLLAGDTKKKEVINRFSGADKVDKALPEVEKDSNKLQTEINELERELTINQTTQSVKAEDLALLENDFSDEVRQAAIKLCEDKLKEIDGELYDLYMQYEKLNDGLIEAQETVKAFKYKQPYDTLIEEKNLLKAIKQKEIDVKKVELSKVKDKFQGDTIALVARENTIKQALLGYKQDLKEAEELESDLNKQIQDAIECPECHHIFSVRDKEFNIKGATEALPDIKEAIESFKQLINDSNHTLNVEIHNEKQAINKKVIDAGEEIKNAIQTLNTEVTTLGSEITTLLNAKREEGYELDFYKDNVKKHIRALDEHKKDNEAKEREKEKAVKELEATKSAAIDQVRVDRLTKELETLIKREEELKELIDEKRKEKESIDAWEIHFKNFKSHLANKSIKNIQDYTNLFLQQMETNLAIEIDGYKTLSNKKIKEQIVTEVLRNGFAAGSYGMFSGGERGRIDISVILAMQELINLNSTTGGLDLLIADEILDQVDSMGLGLIVQALANVGKTIMIVSQNEINTVSEYTLTVQKKNKISTFK